MVRPTKRRLNYIYGFSYTVLFTVLIFSACTNSDKKPGKISNITRSGVGYKDILTRADSYLKKSEYDSALIYYEQAAEMLVIENNWSEYIVTQLKEFDVLRLLGNNQEASGKISEAQKLLNQKLKGNNSLQADIYHKKGILLMDKGSFDSSVVFFNKSLNTRIEKYGKNDTLLALTYNGLGTISFFKGDYDTALEYYKMAYNLALNRKIPEDADLAYYLQNIGIIYAQKGDYSQAESALISSLNINERISAPNDPDLGNRYLNMGRFLALVNKDSESLYFYEKTERIFLEKFGSNHPDLGSLYQNMGQTYIHLADYEKALIFFTKALAIAAENLEPGHPSILQIYMNIGYVYEKKADYESALKYYDLSLPLDKNNPAIIKTYSNLASLYFSMKEPKRADEYYSQAIESAIRLRGKDHPETGLLYTRYGYFLLLADQEDKAIGIFRKAYEISLKSYGRKSREVSNNLTHIGNYYLIKNDIDNALRYYQEAIIALVKDYNNSNFSTNPPETAIDPDRYLVNALNGKAEALSLTGKEINLKNSLDTYKLSIKVVEKLRSTYQNEESKLILADDERKTFLNTVKIATSLYRLTNKKQYLEEAFKYSDKGKSAILFSSIRDIEARQFGKIPDKIQNIEKELKLDLGSFNRYIYEEQQKPQPNENKIKFWESKIFDLEGRYDSLIKVLEKDYPDYYSLKYKEPDVTIEKIRKQLEPGRTVIEYTLSDTLLYIFVINKGGFEVITHSIDSSFYTNINALKDATNSGDLMSIRKEDYLKYTKAAYALYNDLLEPCKELIDGKKLIIIPDSEIGYISFDMLLDAAPDTTTMDFRNLPFLIRNYLISYSASATLQFSGIQTKEKKASRNLLAMAPNYDNLTNLKESGFMDENGKTVYLLPIPGVEEEIKGIKKALSGKTLAGSNATENHFKEIAGKYNILHFAMHTLVNNDKPMLSKLVFYQDKDTLEDGMLNTYELFGMNLNAGLAVLSACNTGTGRLMKGEGMMNLARGFIYAGVPGIVMTLWSVEDQSSAEIVQKFYEYLEDGMSKDEALRQAKLDLLSQGDPLRSHPYYWAAYVTIGDYSPMKFVKPLWTTILFSLIILLSTAGIIIEIAGRRRSGINHQLPSKS